MKVHTRIVFDIATGAVLEDEFHEYDGPLAFCCGAGAAQEQALSQQQAFATTMQTQAGAVFGNSSEVFKDLVNSFAPTLAAGPNQHGFSAAETSNLKSQAITQTGAAYRNAKQAVGEAQAAQGGGNDAGVSGGSKTATDLGVAESAASQTSSQLSQIDQADYATGRQNYQDAAKGLEGATNAFNPVAGIDGAANQSMKNESDTANEIATQSNSWMQAVSGALGSVAGSVATGGMSNLGKGVGFFG